MWDDRSILYDYYDRTTGVLENEFIDESINQISVIAGIKVRL